MSTPPPIVLGLEFSQREGFVAIDAGEKGCQEIAVEVGNREADAIFPAIDKLARTLQVSPDTIGLIAVSIGPGSFTGLRTAVAIAKMHAYSTGAHIIAVETAVVQAETIQMGDGPFFVFSAVKGNGAWFSKVYKEDAIWKCDAKHVLLNEVTGIDEPMAIISDGNAPRLIAEAAQTTGTPLYTITPRASHLIHIAKQLYVSGVHTSAEKLRPLYPREPEAARLWNAKKSPTTPKQPK